ncbi:flagellar hook-basal body complex protein FliE [Pusillimonas sp. CC-YST705]|uniref:Flagellar hook-basal body complex protein FliE n=1 Tax=Mesopusillimonas faecipullorum TaxID=2755040 RepID=A0ABS8C9X8_9BURK|nr:flagellar hook-basal body complex protein FliE [Mesopusillimonas faecipullorum]MCB5362838.1 flagellar hook-basal body complex protein FliE [Mesopusillimonas faecipullorum]
MTSPVSNMAALVGQMRQVAQAAGQTNPTQTEASLPPGGFATELKRALDKVSSMQNAATSQAQAFTMGEPGVALNDVMIDMQKAGIAFQTTVQVRNRLVAAYQEIASMPV